MNTNFGDDITLTLSEKQVINAVMKMQQVIAPAGMANEVAIQMAVLALEESLVAPFYSQKCGVWRP